MINLQTSYLGLKLKNPLIAGSCGLTNSLQNIRELEDKGAGAVVIKSLFEEQINVDTAKKISSEKDEVRTFTRASDRLFGRRIYEYDEAYSYIYDFAKKETLDKYLSFLAETKKAVNIPVIASINCVSNQDWHSFAKKIQQAGADALELNIYILPSDFRRTTDDNEKVYHEIIKEVRNYVTIPIAVKTGYYFSALAQSLQKLSESGIKGLVLFNRPYNTDIDIETMNLSHGNIYSLATEYNHTLRWISILSGRIKCDLSAATGIHNYETVVKQLLAGANTVQLVSVLYKEGFKVIPEILKKMTGWMQRHNFETIDSFRGRLKMENLENPAAIERVQFMKLYSGIE